MINKIEKNINLKGSVTLFTLPFFTIMAMLMAKASFAQELGHIIKNQGHASILYPGKHKAQTAKIGSKVLEDTSIYCHNECYITVKFDNNLTYLKLGHDSKAILNLEQSQKTLYIYLMTGNLKLLFKSSSMMQRALITTPNAKVETENASLLISYSPLFGRTSILNDKGTSSFYKKDRSGGAEVNLAKDDYSLLDKFMSSPTKPETFPVNKSHKLKDLFKVENTEALAL